MIVSWETATEAKALIPASAFWSTQRLGGDVNEFVIAAPPPTVPSAATVESEPIADVEAGMPATYTIQTRREDGSAQPVNDDVFTLTATCAQSGRDNTVSYTAAVTVVDGLYTATFTPEYWCDYDILITMENEYTEANPDVSTIVRDDLTLTVFDDTTVPSAATIVSQPSGDIDAGTTVSYVIQTKSEDGRVQEVDSDVFTVTLTGPETFTATAFHVNAGLYVASLTPTKGGTYDLLITMENDFTSANPAVSTTSSDDQTLSVIDNRTLASAATIET